MQICMKHNDGKFIMFYKKKLWCLLSPHEIWKSNSYVEKQNKINFVNGQIGPTETVVSGVGSLSNHMLV